jgi:tetratricopeptide (TPR) repeat protein
MRILYFLASISYAVVLILAGGCTIMPPAKIPVINPARSSEAARLREIAVLPFERNHYYNNYYGDHDFPNQVQALLASVVINDKPYFRLVDRKHFDTLQKEIELSQSGFVLGKEALRVGKALGVRGMYTGFIERPDYRIEHYQESRPYSECVSYSTDKKGRQYCSRNEQKEKKVNCRKSVAIFAFTPKLIEVETGRIVYSQRHEGTAEASACDDAPSRQIPSQQEAMNDAREIALDKFRRDIAPTTTMLSVGWHSSTDLIKDEAAKKKFEQGLDFAKANRLDRACALWNDVLQTNSHSWALLYNLGLCAEAAGDLPSANDYYRKADNLTEAPDTLISSALARIVARQKDSATLSNQMQR